MFYLALVTPDVMEWIYQPFSPTNKGCLRYNEEVPDSIKAKYVKCHGQETCSVSIGSYDNDRAIAAMELGKTFDTLIDLTNYIKRKNVLVVDEYSGHSY